MPGIREGMGGILWCISMIILLLVCLSMALSFSSHIFKLKPNFLAKSLGHIMPTRRADGPLRGGFLVKCQWEWHLRVIGVHYDLRLQISESSSISFAIMYGLPGNPNSRRLNRNATETRVHNLWVCPFRSNHSLKLSLPGTAHISVLFLLRGIALRTFRNAYFTLQSFIHL